MTSMPKPSDPTEAYACKWDAWNRLVKVEEGSPATTVAVYAYDGLYRRVTKTVGSTVRHFYYSNEWQVLEERTGSSTSADRQFVWGRRYLDDLVLRDRGSERLYCLHDFFSATAIVDTSGTVQERFDYDAFGTVRFMDADFAGTTSSFEWETLFSAYRHDLETGLYQARFRFFHVRLGRWISRDLLDEQVDEWNLYRFVNNAPMRFYDNFGLTSAEEACIAECDRQLRLCMTIGNIACIASCGVGCALVCTGSGLFYAACVAICGARCYRPCFLAIARICLTTALGCRTGCRVACRV
jgi:RHS repeat-associated protein